MTIKRVGSISIEELIKRDEEAGRASADSFKYDSTKKRLEGDELRAEKKNSKYYLPVLHINDATMWPPKPKAERKHLTSDVAKDVCTNRCCGVDGLTAACCKLDPDDIEHVLGPLSEEYIEKLIKWFQKKGINFKRKDIVVDFEEGVLIGRKFFNGHSVFEDRKSYPFFRFQVDGPRFSCKFLDPNRGFCTIYDMRPDMCKNYYCNYIKSNFFIKSKEKPNTWTMVNKIDNENDEE
jgi:Fe-S-cluster containining protein